jgi:peptidoglycan/LPS O-acetylase OafA/YrhL
MEKKRLLDIDRAKGLAIFLVVLGHLFAIQSVPAEHHWYVILKSIIYSFHMSFFMFLAGFVMFYTYKPIKTVKDYIDYTLKRFWRLIPAYILFGLLILIAKLGAQAFTPVDNSLTSFSEIFNIFLFPRLSFSRFLWFIYVIFIFYAAVPILLTLSHHKRWPLLVAGLGLYFLPRSDLFAIGFIESYFVTFMLGGILATHQEAYINWLNKWGGVCFAVFVVMLVLVIPLNIEPFPTRVAPLRLVVGLISIPAIHWLVRLKVITKMQILIFWGTYAFPIYLMNTIAIGATKAILLKFVGLEEFNFIWIAVCTMVIGLYGPIFLKLICFSRIPILDKITN